MGSDITKNISGLCPWFLAQSFKNHWNFLNDKCLCYVNEVIHALCLDSFRMEADHQKDQARDSRVGPFIHQISREEMRAGNGIQSHGQCLNKSYSPNKTSTKTLDSRLFLVGEHTDIPRVWGTLTPWGESMEGLCLTPSHTMPYSAFRLGDPALCSL